MNAPSFLIHGTKAKYIDSIMREGLVPGGMARGSRNENHFATVEAWDHHSAGYRYESEVSIYLNVPLIIQSNMKFWLSKSGAIVTEEIVAPFFMDKIVHNRSRDVMWTNPRLRAAAARDEDEEVEERGTREETPAASRRATSAEVRGETSAGGATDEQRQAELRKAEEIMAGKAEVVREATLAVAKRGVKSKGAPKPPPPYHKVLAPTSKAASPAVTPAETAKETQEQQIKESVEPTLVDVAEEEKTTREKEGSRGETPAGEGSQEAPSQTVVGTEEETKSSGVSQEAREETPAAFECRECGKKIVAGTRICTGCWLPALDDSLAEAQAGLQGEEFADEIALVINWTDRGVRDSRTAWTHKMKKYLKRALKKHGELTGFTSIEDRFNKDELFRTNLETMGWTKDNITQADQVAKGDHSAFDKRTSEHRWLHARAQERDPLLRNTSSIARSREVAAQAQWTARGETHAGYWWGSQWWSGSWWS